MLFASLAGQQALAQTFSSNGLVYNVTSSSTVEVGFQDGAATGTITIPSQVTYNSTVYSVTNIGNNAFETCTITSVIIPNSVTSIGYSAFNNCSTLTSITIPNSVTSISDYAFMSCVGLTSVICNATTPITINNTVFYGVNQAACSLTVPAGSVAAYEAATVWQDFNPINGDLVNPTFAATSLQLYPVPVKNTLYIQSSNNMVMDKITITDLTGKIVVTQTTNTNQVEVQQLTSGMYIIQAVSGDSTLVKKFIKE